MTSTAARRRGALPRRRGSLFGRSTPVRSKVAPVLSPSGGPLVGEADGERGVALAARMAGERALPVDGGMVLLSPGRLCRHLLVCGATGSGKTETVLRLAWTVA